MNILQINCVYKKGSTGKMVYDIHNGLRKKEIDSVVCYGRGTKSNTKNVYKVSSELEAKVHSVFSRLFGVQFGFSPLATRKTINIIKKENPDVVHLHCLNGHFINVYRLLKYLKKRNIKTVLTLHAEIMHTAGCEHAMDCEKWKTHCYSCPKIKGLISRYFRDDAKACYRKMKNAFKGFENLTVVGVSEWLTERAKQSAVFDKGTVFKTVHNGIDTDAFKITDYQDLYTKYNIPKDKQIVLHATPNFNHPIKGGKYVLETAKKLPDIQFVIVGFNGDEDILPKNVIPIAHTKDKAEMAQFYNLADVTLLTSKRETFSMVVAESLSCGTPVVGFEAGAPETITIPKYSEFSKQGDVDALIENINKILSRDLNNEEISKEAKKKYACEKMVKNYILCYMEMI